MTTPTGGYGAASPARARAFDDVMSASRPGRVTLKAIMYINGQQFAESPIFNSGTQPGPNSTYALRGNRSQEMRMSRNDAEVQALDWAEERARSVTNRDEVRSVQVDLVADTGACNGCKTRQQMLADRVGQLFPRTNGRVAVKPNYDDYSPHSATDGRRDFSTGQVLSTYGYNDATRRTNSYTADNNPEAHATYWQRAHVPGGSAGVVDPSQINRATRTTPPTSDRDSPKFPSSSSNTSGDSPPRRQSPPQSAAQQSAATAQSQQPPPKPGGHSKSGKDKKGKGRKH
ncbi:hypothetical protein ACTWQF_11180 [Streptomyces sp. 8N114]|uniref:hypothetical protein n=1 Tax=Streptomyces sp. 8N114 TaxID=3457419 RepID=UPI003FD42E50